MKEVTIARKNAATTFRRVVENTERDSKVIQAMIDASASSILVLDEDRTIVFANRAWRQFATRTGSLWGDHGIGKRYPDLFAGMASASHDDALAIRNGVESVIQHEEIEFRFKYRCNAVTEPLWIEMHAAAFVHSTDSNARLILVSHDDVSAAETTSSELQKDEARLRRLLETTKTLPWERNAGNTRFTYVGEQAIDLLGYSAEQWKEEGFWELHIHPADRSRVVSDFSRLSATADHFKCEYRMIAKDGRIVWIEDLVDVVREWSKPAMMQGFMTNISERKQAATVLADLGGRLINAQEDERKRIARELHDDLNQRIALISIELEQVAQLSILAPGGLANRLAGIKRKVSEISNEIHRMSYELHPSKLDHLGLAPALNGFCRELAKSRGIRIDFQQGSLPATLPRDITLCIFRVAQEALQNSAKHSGADEMTVELEASGERLELKVSDTGRGFATTPERMTKGLGLTSIQERVRQVGGEFRIVSEPTHGTTVHVTVPIERSI